MFVNCPHCRALIATDPATDLPPARCPRCASDLRSAVPEPAANDVTPTQRGEPGTPSADHGGDAAVSDSSGTAVESPTPAPSEAAVATATDSAEPMIDAAPADAEAPLPDAVEARAPEAPAPAPAATTAPHRGKSAPSFVRTRVPVTANARQRWLLPSLIAGLSLLLALQWILADRARLAADARWRPFLVQLCGVLRCSLPPWREPSAFALLERDVRPHPAVPGALRVSATFRNDARWPQPWPEVVLTLSDVDGDAVGARAFDAADYLGAPPTQNELASGQTAAIRMDVREPAPRSVAFAFDFR